MNIKVVEISGYVPAFVSLYTTNRNVDEARLRDILYHVKESTDSNGFVVNPTKEFNTYMEKLIKYGIKHRHESLLDFIKISIYMEGIHRGAQDDWDSHAKRLDIIRSSTRANKKSSTQPEISDWYKNKIKFFSSLPIFTNKGEKVKVGDTIIFDADETSWLVTPWGFVREDYANNNDALRGLVPLAVACDNISTISFRNLRHVYHLRRRGTTASPELQEAMEMVREELIKKSPYLGDFLGKVWVSGIDTTEVTIKGHYEERNATVTLSKFDLAKLGFEVLD